MIVSGSEEIAGRKESTQIYAFQNSTFPPVTMTNKLDVQDDPRKWNNSSPVPVVTIGRKNRSNYIKHFKNKFHEY